MAKKVTALTALTAPEATDLLHIVDDAAGTPVSKKITKHNFEKPHITSETSSATPTINIDICDIHQVTALATNITDMSANLTGTPYNWQKLIVTIKDNGTSRDIAWGSAFEAGAKALPEKTVVGKTLYALFFYNSVTAKFRLFAVDGDK